MKWIDKKVVASFFTSDDDIFIIVLYQRKASFLPCVLPTTSNLENIRSFLAKVTDALVLTWDVKPVPQISFLLWLLISLSDKSHQNLIFIDLKHQRSHQRNYYNIVMLSSYCV